MFVPHVIAGRETESADGARFASVDPWTRRAWASAALAGPADVDRAVRAARQEADHGHWPRLGFAERGRLLHRLADLIVRDGEELATADTSDMGRPRHEVLTRDVPRAAANFRFFADHARLCPAEVFPADGGHLVHTRYPPAGVVAAVAPWNFPLMLGSWKIAPALAWGNTVVLKPAEQSPASATALARLALEAGFPPGVLNVVHGPGPNAAGEWLVSHPGVDRVTFTGESATGRAVATAASANLTPVSMELGGKGASVVFADADLAVAADHAAHAAFGNAGQMCLAGTRILVQRPVHDEFHRLLADRAAAMPVGDPRDPATRVGPLSSAEHHRKVTAYLAMAGHPLPATDDWTVPPALLTGVPPASPLWREEIFGPVAVIAPFDTEQEAVRLANDTSYGLNAMLFTTDLNRAHRVAAALRGGTVWVNCFFVRDLRAPFGGAGDSGIGREGGVFSRDFFTEPRTVTLAID
ncbi:5-carboxymethyl-2-hydroxymuconate semialdehyde dehydrogenase [Actinophytocola xinjiangensis]|uniref:5-carboxymethyl-2-hydroxymuconate semialdehyde dehydrogenase n=1 Tax=Actinophytocola xinjiangensis TaxID=485602 RepID=A0A7Z0WSQ1_9PSEU|nr:aldehyde dehydrogenase [Actinophytocola xinjiangensis]OLF14172.1 5-carboxymethyl-2-hydroxymuconate semialdehyde dehydrogenase [Actinophytocola xinjiangensis]